jgi:hypothetical protein
MTLDLSKLPIGACFTVSNTKYTVLAISRAKITFLVEQPGDKSRDLSRKRILGPTNKDWYSLTRDIEGLATSWFHGVNVAPDLEALIRTQCANQDLVCQRDNIYGRWSSSPQ